MAIAIGTGNIWPAQNTATPYDAAITPGATPNGVCVIIVQTTVTDLVTSVAYGTGAGSVLLTRRRFDTEGGTEPGGVYIYWAGDGTVFPSGTQTVRVVRTGSTAIRMVVWTMTVAANKIVAFDSEGFESNTTGEANPAWTHTSAHNNVVAMLGIHSGLNSMTTTPATNWTRAVGNTTSEDITGTGRGWAERTLATAGSLGAGWTAATSEDFVGSSIAFWETDPPPPPSGPPILVMARPTGT